MSNGEGQAEAQDVTGRQLGEVVQGLQTGTATSPEAQAILNNLSEVPSDFLDNIAGSTEIPDKIVEAAVKNFFGEGRPASVSLKKMRDSSERRMNEIKDAFSDQNLLIIKKQLEETIKQDEGLGQFFRLLDPTQQGVFINNILETQLMQTVGKQKFIETLVDCESGGPEYQALLKEVTQLESIIVDRRAELKALNTTLDFYGAEITEAKIPDLEESNEVLKGQIRDSNKQISELNGQRTIILKKLTDRTDEDSAELIKLQDEITKHNQSIDLAKKNIKENEALKSKAREKKANEEKRDGIEEKLIEFEGKLSGKKGELNEAGNEFFKKLNAFSASLETVLPEAAKDTLRNLKSRANEANRIALEKEGNEKMERGKEEGDMKEQFKGYILKAVARRHVDEVTLHPFLRRSREGFRICIEDLRDEFSRMMQNPSQTSNSIIREVLDDLRLQEPDLFNYFDNNNEALQELNQEMEDGIFLETTRKGVMHLQLDRRTLEVLGTMPEFRKAATQAIAANKETREMVEKLTGEDLGSKGGIKKLWEKMPLGGAIGAIMFLIAILGLGVGGKKLVGGE